MDGISEWTVIQTLPYLIYLQFATPLISACDWEGVNSQQRREEERRRQAANTGQDQLVVFDPELFSDAAIQQAHFNALEHRPTFSVYNTTHSDRDQNLLPMTIDDIRNEESQELRKSFSDR